MAFQDTYCEDLESQLDAGISSLTQAKATIDGALSEVDALLAIFDLLASSTAEQITNGIFDIQSAATDSIPLIPDASDMEDLINACTQFKVNFDLGSPRGIAEDFANKAANALGTAIGSAFDILTGLPEFAISELLNGIEDILSQIQIPDLLGLLDGILECLDQVCGSDVSSEVDQIDDLLNGMSLDDSGLLDKSTIFSDSGISQDKIDDLTTIGDQIVSAKDDAADALQTSKDILKGNTKAIKKAASAIAGAIDIPFA